MLSWNEFNFHENTVKMHKNINGCKIILSHTKKNLTLSFWFCSEIWAVPDSSSWSIQVERSILSYGLTQTRTRACQWPESSAKTRSIQTTVCVIQKITDSFSKTHKQHRIMTVHTSLSWNPNAKLRYCVVDRFGYQKHSISDKPL